MKDRIKKNRTTVLAFEDLKKAFDTTTEEMGWKFKSNEDKIRGKKDHVQHVQEFLSYRS